MTKPLLKRLLFPVYIAGWISAAHTIADHGDGTLPHRIGAAIAGAAWPVIFTVSAVHEQLTPGATISIDCKSIGEAKGRAI